MEMAISASQADQWTAQNLGARGPWRASAGASQSSSLSLDTLVVNRIEVSARFLPSQDHSTAYATPLSSMHHLDDLIADFNSDKPAAAFSRGPSYGGGFHDAMPPMPSLPRILVPSASYQQLPAASLQRVSRPPRPDCFLLSDSSASLPRPPDCASALRAFLVDDAAVHARPGQAAQASAAACQAHQQHSRHASLANIPSTAATSVPPASSSAGAAPFASSATAAPPPPAPAACDEEGETELAQAALCGAAGGSLTGPATAAILAPAAAPVPAQACGLGSAQPIALSDENSGPAALGASFGQPLAVSMLSGLRKAASDVVTQLRALGSTGGRSGSRTGTGVTTPTTSMATPTALASHRNSTDNGQPFYGAGGSLGSTCWYDCRGSTGTVSSRANSGLALLRRTVTPGASLLAAPNPQPQTRLSRTSPADPSAARWCGGVASATGGTAATAESGSLGDMSGPRMPSPFLVPPSSFSSLGGGGRGGGGGGGGGGFMDETQESDLLPDMWDLAQMLDQVDDGFPAHAPLHVSLPAAPHASRLLETRTAPVTAVAAPPARGQEDSGHGPGLVSPVLLAPRCRSSSSQRGVPKPPAPLSSAHGPRAQLHPAAPTSQSPRTHHHRRPMSGHDMEQMHVFSELVQQARDSIEGARVRRGGVAAASAAPPTPRSAASGSGGGGGAAAPADASCAMPSFGGNAAAGGLVTGDTLFASAPPSLGACAALCPPVPFLVPPSMLHPSVSLRPSATAVEAWASAASAKGPAGPGAALFAGRGSTYGPYCGSTGDVSGMGMGMSMGMGGGGGGGGDESGRELTMLWPMFMPTPVPAVLAGGADGEDGGDGTAACAAFLLGVNVGCGCDGDGARGGCRAGGGGSAAGAASRAFFGRGPRAPTPLARPSAPLVGPGTPSGSPALPQPHPGPSPNPRGPLPPPPDTGVTAMLSGVHLARAPLVEGGCHGVQLRLPLLPAMQLVNVFTSSGSSVGPAANLLAVPTAMADELNRMFVERVATHVRGSESSSGGARGAGPDPLTDPALPPAVRDDLAVLARASASQPPWCLCAPVWSAALAEWRSCMQPLLTDICYLLLCVPNCFAHGLVEWDRAMYCETLARLLGQLERHALWQTLSVLLEYCTRQGVALLYQGEAVGAGSLSAERVRTMLEGALYDEISIKAVGTAAGGWGEEEGRGGGGRGAAAAAMAALARVNGSSSGARSRRASVAATLMTPDAADAAAALTLQAWRRRSVDAPVAGLQQQPRSASAASALAANGGPEAAEAGGASCGQTPKAGGVAALLPPARSLRSQASLGRVLSRVLSRTGGAEVEAPDTEEAGPGRRGGATPHAAAPAAAEAPPADAPAPGRRLGHMVENAAVVLAFAGLMLQTLL